MALAQTGERLRVPSRSLRASPSGLVPEDAGYLRHGDGAPCERRNPRSPERDPLREPARQCSDEWQEKVTLEEKAKKAPKLKGALEKWATISRDEGDLCPDENFLFHRSGEIIPENTLTLPGVLSPPGISPFSITRILNDLTSAQE